jgi:hypothetical protein
MRPLHELARIGIGLPQFLDQRTWLFGLATRAVRATAITELPPGKAFAGGRIAITRTSTGAASCISNGRRCHQQCCSKRKNADTEHGHDGVVLNQLVSGAGNRASKLHTGSCRLSWSSEREVSEPSVRRAASMALLSPPAWFIQLIELNSISDMTTIISSHSSKATMISSIHSVEL